MRPLYNCKIYIYFFVYSNSEVLLSPGAGCTAQAGGKAGTGFGGGAASLALAERLVDTVQARGGQLAPATQRSLMHAACRCRGPPDRHQGITP